MGIKSLRQWQSRWAKELNDSDLRGCIYHLQSLGVDEKARKAGAHAVIDQIHTAIMSRFSSSIEDPNAEYVEVILDKEADKNYTSGDVSENNRLLNSSNAVSSSLSTLTHRVYQGREHFYKGGIEAGDPMVIDGGWHPRRLTLAFDGV